MKKFSRTINPLHFEDLEPHRFEDLVRQLIYDFREWRALEATGRSGAEKGFDVRAWEIVYKEVEYKEQEEEEGVEEEYVKGEDRIWLIQCKREKHIGPKKMRGYIEEIEVESENPLYGIIFVGACDFSKETRETFYTLAREKGVQEHYIWGKGELEDMLFQPKNDHLLFAYFGFSISIRKKSLKSQIKSKLGIKRKIIKIFGPLANYYFDPVLIRDPSDIIYPSKEMIKDFSKNPRWLVYYFLGHYFGGIMILAQQFLAYIDDDNVHWDYIKNIDEVIYRYNPWLFKDESEKKEYDLAYNFWNEIPLKNRALLKFHGLIKYDNIVEIDPDGDDIFKFPHIYVNYVDECWPFEKFCYFVLKPTGGVLEEIKGPENKNKIDYFPENFSNIKKKKKRD